MKVNYLNWSDMTSIERKSYFNRSEQDISLAMEDVKTIIDKVKKDGDRAIYHYNKIFDHVKIDNYSLKVTDNEFRAGISLVSDKVKEAINVSIGNVRKFHETQKPQEMTMTEIQNGLFAGEKAIPIESVGLYVPRGRGSFPSMLYMQAIPAIVAGVKNICIISPPDENGDIDPACLYAASQCGIKHIYKTGGAQAIAALTYGTESINAVHKITGPGSKYVSAAKRILSGLVDSGLPAGPSDSAIIADETANPYKVALDLMTEAEHGSDSSAILVTDSKIVAQSTIKHMNELIKALPEERAKFVSDVFKGYGGVIITKNLDESAEVINIYGPEHLQIVTKDPWSLLNLIKNAGEILLGSNTPFSCANYSIGANAVLPTGGKAKTWSALSVRDFIKYSSIVYSSKEAYDNIKEHVNVLAQYEGFIAHANAIKLRDK